jgi:hypothetical protein
MAREGRCCVFPADVVLPDVCVKCGGQRDIVRTKKTYRYESALAHFAGDDSTKREVAIDLPLCARCNRRQRVVRALVLAGWGVVLAPMPLIAVLGKHLPENFGAALAFFFFGGVLITGPLHLLFGSRRMLPAVVRIDSRGVVLAHLGKKAITRLESLALPAPEALGHRSNR